MKNLLQYSPEILKNKFHSLTTHFDLCDLLEIKYKDLIYYLYRIDPDVQYKTFYIPKKNGSFREINSPISTIKIIQKKLAQILNAVYLPKEPAHGFIIEKSILSNARLHVRRKYVLNLDLENFFPTINFGRIRGMFLKKPYNFDPKTATIIAQICCYKGFLPQGAPTSPILSNMICSKLDSNLSFLASKNKCIYTRYADDLSFSTSLTNFPKAIAKPNPTGLVELGEELKKIIRDNGFEVNSDKIRLQYKQQRQEVTGLVVNEFPNVKRKFVRQIRAMLHAWEKFGYDSANYEYSTVYNNKTRFASSSVDFAKVVAGKIEFLGFIKGKDNQIYQSFLNKLIALDPEKFKYLEKFVISSTNYVNPLVFTEGKTDLKHLRAALNHFQKNGEFTEIKLEFDEEEKEMGDEELLKLCKNYVKMTGNAKPIIFIFDRDNEKIISQVDNKGSYKIWGNNVYSFSIPIPDHRTDLTYSPIEFYYKNEDLKICDVKSRRLFLSDEFDKNSGRHLFEKELSCNNLKKIKDSKLNIIDNSVFNSESVNVSLSKNDFAENILLGIGKFADVDFASFKKIFDLILQIIKIQDN
ncbi:MAG: RNA-directed DNA polymerase [Ignavibacteria bacterium]|nr:RNA-directed DNA polymerase [Ignavibacteria bacterium]